MIEIVAWESPQLRLFRAFSASGFKGSANLGRCPRLLHSAPLALRIVNDFQFLLVVRIFACRPWTAPPKNRKCPSFERNENNERSIAQTDNEKRYQPLVAAAFPVRCCAGVQFRLLR